MKDDARPVLTEPLDMTQVRRGAILSSDSRYRYRLIRDWAGGMDGEPLVFCMLNPSTADHQRDDQTVKVCSQRAHMLRYPGLVVVNLFGFRATQPADLKKAIHSKGVEYAKGPENYAYLLHAFAGRDVVLAWGQNAQLWTPDYAWEVTKLAHKEAAAVYILKRRKCGSPAHPLYVAYGDPLIRI